MKQVCVWAFLFVLSVASTAFAADPLTVHNAGFGPGIRGLRLGTPMSWLEMLDTQRNIMKKPSKPWVPGTPPPIPVPVAMIGSIYIADNGKAVDRQDNSTDKAGKWVLVNYSANGASVMNGGGGMLSEIPKKGTLDGLFALLKKNGLNYASTPNITLRDERVIQYSIDKDKLPVDATTTAQLALWVKNVCSLKKIEQKGDHYEASNELEGWRMVVTDNTVTVFIMPIPDSPQ